MITIATKFCNETNLRPQGVIALTFGKSRFFSWQFDMSGGENHRWAALQLAVEIGYAGRFYQSDNPNHKLGFVFACLRDEDPAFTVGKALTAAEHFEHD